MDIHEYQAKNLFKKFGIHVPKGVVVSKLEDTNNAIKGLDGEKLMVKAQIHAGGRGKAGGAKLSSRKDVSKVVEQMLMSTLVTHQTGPSGQTVRSVYIEEACSIAQEYYISAVLDRNLSQITFIASADGGMDIEEVAKNSPSAITKISIDPNFGFQPFHSRILASSWNVPKDAFKSIHKLMSAMYSICLENDAIQVEINPLAKTQNGDFIPLDAKISFDDNSLYRNPEISKLKDDSETEPTEIIASSNGLSYIKMDGQIACMVNGAGLAMATMDIVKYYGKDPANFLDVGGGATLEQLNTAFEIILNDKNVKAIFINIFGGIMKCDIMANSIVHSLQSIGCDLPIMVRLSGTNADLANEILSKSNLKLQTSSDLGEAAKKIVEMVGE